MGTKKSVEVYGKMNSSLKREREIVLRSRNNFVLYRKEGRSEENFVISGSLLFFWYFFFFFIQWIELLI